MTSERPQGAGRRGSSEGAPSEGFHMSVEDFRRNGHQLVDWLGDYMSHVADLPVASSVQPGDVANSLPVTAPEQPESFERLIGDLDSIVLPGITHWQSPGWFAFYPANTSGPSILAELVTAGLGVQGMLWSSSPACTEVESRVVDWLVDLLGLPPSWKTSVGPGGGVLQGSASDSTHLVHVVARHLASKKGIGVDSLVAYTSEEAHSSVEKGARVAGIPHFRKVSVDDSLAMRVDELDALVREDRDRGLTPLIVTSTVGTTGTAAIDPVAEVSRVATASSLWHHVDAAYGGSGMICPELRELQAGVEQADSYTFNPHKWMFTNFDCNVLYVADRKRLISTMSISPPYLANAQSDAGNVIDYRDWQVPLGRRFRSLKLWWVIRSYGAEGIRFHLREHMAMAKDLGARISEHDLLELVAPVQFGLVTFRHRGGDADTTRILEHVNRTGRAYLTGSISHGRRYIRVSIGQTHTSPADVDNLWREICEVA